MENPIEISIPLEVMIGAILMLLLLSALFSASETAFTAAQRARIHLLANEGSRRAKAAERIINARESVLGTVLLGNNLVNILASALATGVMIELFGSAGVLYATAMMTLLVVVFTEVLPKTYAITRAEHSALALSIIMEGVIWLFRPFVAMVHFVVRGIFRLFGYDRSEEHT
ncbi:MAG TPA: hypothetical protein DCO82_05330, partial [Alphaproteobacteria bacterium]|nr:hypothetical protein [Alphaproteobacteria bacterium]